MAGNILNISSAQLQTTTATRTILQLTAGAARCKVSEISVSFKGTVQGNAPVLVQVVRQQIAASGSGSSAAVPTRLHRTNSDTTLASGASGFTSEPSAAAGDVLVMQELVHPQTGFTWQARFGAEIQVPPTERLGVTVLATVDVGCSARMTFEE